MRGQARQAVSFFQDLFRQASELKVLELEEKQEAKDAEEAQTDFFDKGVIERFLKKKAAKGIQILKFWLVVNLH